MITYFNKVDITFSNVLTYFLFYPCFITCYPCKDCIVGSWTVPFAEANSSM